MKKFWQWPLGQRTQMHKQRVELTRWLGAPFFCLWLVLLQFGDVGRFGARVAIRGGREITKGWGITIFLGVAVVVMGWQIAFFLGQERIRIENEIQAGERARVVIEETFALPPEIKIATDKAQVRLGKQEILALCQEADGLSAEKIGGLTQGEMLNYALAFYYTGNQEKYRQWLEWGRAMDPNEEVLAKK